MRFYYALKSHAMYSMCVEMAGVALFDLDHTLVERFLPILRLGLFRPKR